MGIGVFLLTCSFSQKLQQTVPFLLLFAVVMAVFTFPLMASVLDKNPVTWLLADLIFSSATRVILPSGCSFQYDDRIVSNSHFSDPPCCVLGNLHHRCTVDRVAFWQRCWNQIDNSTEILPRCCCGYLSAGGSIGS